MRRPLVLAAAAGFAAAFAALPLPRWDASPPPARAQDAPPGTEAEAADPVADLQDLADAVVDRMVEHGATLHRPDYGDPVVEEERTIVITGEINALTARDVISKLHFLDRTGGAGPIDLYIRTNGGWVDDAFAICDTMQVIGCPVNTWAMGACDSAGAILLAAGTGTRRALPHSMITLHFNEEEGDEPHSPARVSRERALAFWKRNARLPAEFLPMTGDSFHALSPGKAKEFGVVDEVVEARPRRVPGKEDGR